MAFVVSLTILDTEVFDTQYELLMEGIPSSDAKYLKIYVALLENMYRRLGPDSGKAEGQPLTNFYL